MIPAVTISLAVRAGSVCDPVDGVGTMNLLSKVIDRGTTARSAADIAEDLDSRGISLPIGVTRHLFSLVCTCLAEDFGPVLALLGDIVMSPTFPEAELTARRAEVVTAIRQDEDNPAVRAVESLMALLYQNGHPYGQRAKGTIDTVEHLGREALVRTHAARFAPGEICAVVVGDVPVQRVHEVADRVFGSWRANSLPQPIVSRPSARTTRLRQVVPMMNKAQADIAYGFTSVARTDPAYYAFWLMNNVLGQYSMGGRLGDRIRERQGMAYYVYSNLDANVVEGPLTIRAGVSPGDVDRAVASIDEEVQRFAREGPTLEELRESQQYLVASLPRALETNASIATFLHSAEFFQLGLDYDRRLPDLLRTVTLDEVHAAAKRVLDPAKATIVVAGPYEDQGVNLAP